MRRILTVVIVVTGLTALGGAQRLSTDWTQWRGPNRDGVIPSFAAPSQWPDQLVRRWKVAVGTGYATPIVVGNRIYQFSRLGDNETMTALDAENGRVLWQTGYPAVFTMQSGAARHGMGPKSMPVFSNGRLFSIGMTGIVTAFDAATGKQVWQKPGSANVPLYTSHAFSPLVDRGLVIFHVGGHEGGALTAFDVNTGDVKWSWPGDGPGYGSPVIAELGGTRQLVTNTQTKLVGIAPATGALLWEQPFASSNSTNSLTPIIAGQLIILSNNVKPTTAFAVAREGDRWTVKTVWENDVSPIGRLSNAVTSGNLLFGLTSKNAGQYFASDLETGKTVWTSEGRQANNASISRAGDILFSLEEDGDLVIFTREGTTFALTKRYQVADSETWGPPAVSGDRIFVKDLESLTLWTLK